MSSEVSGWISKHPFHFSFGLFVTGIIISFLDKIYVNYSGAYLAIQNSRGKTTNGFVYFMFFLSAVVLIYGIIRFSYYNVKKKKRIKNS
jgi:hypothetical protein